MSTRRPRVKAAAILKPRRPQVSTDSAINKPDKTSSDGRNSKITVNGGNEETGVGVNVDNGISTATSDVIIDVKPSNIDIKPSNIDIKSDLLSDHVITKSPNNVIELEQPVEVSEQPIEANPISDVKSFKAVPKLPNLPVTPTPTPTSFRRISTPPVHVVNRRKSVIAAENASNFSSPKYIKSPSYSFVRDAQTKDTKSKASPYHNANNSKPVNGDDGIFSPTPIDNDECFKSPPFMSPIYTRRVEPSPSMSPFHDVYGDDYAKSLLQSPKIRQRIRPTPCFANRRNSIQGSSLGAAFESEDEQNRRQRHYSTSSNHSSYNPASTPQHSQRNNNFALNKTPSRVRTESFSSSMSDIPFSKNKRSHRSEEYQRVANAKREFNQRLNGQPPDKSRLTMYDLIYYNPLTNPMSKPAGKGDKNSDTASMSSAKTVQSRNSDSVKSEASVKSEKSEKLEKVEKVETNDALTGPVPQLKLDANGEIILDEKSLIIETTGEKEARELLANLDVVYDDEFSGTSGFYKRQKRTRDWLPLETLKFYRSLQTIGTDFSVMLQLFPNRSRRDLKLKFKKEEKHNMALINKALLHPKEFNVDELKLQFDKEDEEIEQRKQEWAEVRKKMAIERREQLNASKKRNPYKQLSRSMRNLTMGDIIYDNEFVHLPPKTKRNRKRDIVTDPYDTLKNPPDDCLFSPSSLNHNNNHVDPLPQHTYATHKLPSFIEMMSSKTSRSNSSPTQCENVEHNTTNPNIESNSHFGNDDESVHAIDLSTTSSPIVVHSVKTDNLTEQPNNDNQSTIGQYIASNPNLTYKGSGDIMNMDIIFDNVSIEEDSSIAKDSKTQIMACDTDENDVLNDIQTTDYHPISEEHVSIVEQMEHVDINGVHYQIITIDQNTNENDDQLDNNTAMSNKEMCAESNLSTTVHVESAINNLDDSMMPLVGLDSNEELVVISNLDVGSEVETGNAIDMDTPIEQSINEIPPTNAALNAEPTTELNKNTDDDLCVSKIKDETVETNTKPNVNERKRRRKVVPLLDNNKRTRKTSTNSTIQTKIEQFEPIEEINVTSSCQSEEKTIKTDDETALMTNSESTIKLEDSCHETTTEQILDTHESEYQTDEVAQISNDTPEHDFMDSLVVVEIQDPNDPNRTIHEVRVVDPDTNEISEKPLELPEHVIQRIRLAIS